MLRPLIARCVLIITVLGSAGIGPVGLICPVGLPPAHGQEVLDGIAAVVNQEVITFSQVRELVGAREQAARSTLKGKELSEKVKEIRTRAINDLVDRQLILQDFKKNKFQLPTHMIDDRINSIVRTDFVGDRSAFIRTLSAQGYSLERFRALEMDKSIVETMRRQMVKVGEAKVPERDIAAYYQEHLAEYTAGEQVKLRMLTIRKAEGAAEARRKMVEEIRQKVLEGAEFQDLARLYSEDTNQESGGDWGWINRKTLNEALTKAAFGLKSGKVSEVLEIDASYYLLWVEAKKNSVTRPLSEVHEEIQKRLTEQVYRQREQEWIAKLRKKAYIKFF